jgi:hypothetical protein
MKLNLTCSILAIFATLKFCCSKNQFWEIAYISQTNLIQLWLLEDELKRISFSTLFIRWSSSNSKCRLSFWANQWTAVGMWHMLQLNVPNVSRFQTISSSHGRPAAGCPRHLSFVHRCGPTQQAGGVPQVATAPLASLARPHSMRERALARSACLREHAPLRLPSLRHRRPILLARSTAQLRSPSPLWLHCQRSKV